MTRLVQLLVGLVLFGVSMALFVEAHLGVMPWDVLHQGIANRSGLSLGVVAMIAGAVVLMLWIPLRERPGLGTVANVLIVGLSVDLALRVLPTPEALPVRIGLVGLALVLNAVATAAYIGARFGPGPRDGLMTGLVRVTGAPVALVKGSIEVTVVLAGWLLGGVLGVGTVAYALGIGPLVHLLLPRFDLAPPAGPRTHERPAATLVATGRPDPAG